MKQQFQQLWADILAWAKANPVTACLVIALVIVGIIALVR